MNKHDKVRFIAPVPVDSKVRARQKLEALPAVPLGLRRVPLVQHLAGANVSLGAWCVVF